MAPAAADLATFSDYRGSTYPGVLFRGETPGDLVGPYVSQFLLRDIPYGTLTISQRQKTFLPGTNYLTDYTPWLANKRGIAPSTSVTYDSTRRYIRNGRDLAPYVQIDALYEAYLNACLILMGLGAPLDAGNPYNGFTKTDAFGTFGGPHILSLVTEVATRALKAVWFQKWYVHRRLRPEEFGGRIHNHITGAAHYPINSEILQSSALDRIFSKYGTYLLPQAYPEACPLHPAYGSGHATVAGACVTILKAWFDESWALPDLVQPNADGTALDPYSQATLTVGGELNKVAANIATGRNFAGIHWRSDATGGIQLGEEVAIAILQDLVNTFAEDFEGFRFTRFDGRPVSISRMA
jgi:membrane-associated phospholipid phosphatase